jgi:hypothetical protein
MFESRHCEDCNQGDQMKECEMGQICSVHRGDEKRMQNLVKSLKGKTILESHRHSTVQ